jgi:hypothetical protein
MFDAMVRLAWTSCSNYGLQTREGLLVYSAIMFLLGSHFDRDPLHPWVSQPLNSALGMPEKARALQSAAHARLEQYISLARTTGGVHT